MAVKLLDVVRKTIVDSFEEFAGKVRARFAEVEKRYDARLDALEQRLWVLETPQQDRAAPAQRTTMVADEPDVFRPDCNHWLADMTPAEGGATHEGQP